MTPGDRLLLPLLASIAVWLYCCKNVTATGFVPPLLAAAVAGGSYLLGREWQSAKSLLPLAVQCQLGECCDRPYVRMVSNDYAISDDTLAEQAEMIQLHLRQNLSRHVHGQHLIVSALPTIVKNHIMNRRRRKPLVMSLHGTTGVGKNYVAEVLASTLYQHGMASRYVHLFIGGLHFPHTDDASVASYTNQLRSWIESNITECGRSMFIFDEIDKMPAGILDAVKPYMDYYGRLGGVNIADSMFVLLSNTGGRAINTAVFRHWQDQHERESLMLRHFRAIIDQGAFNENGGLYRADIIRSALIDFYLPMLAMERKHVRACIEDEFERRRWNRYDHSHVEKVLAEIRFDQRSGQFAKFGCKDVANKVNLIIDRMIHDPM